MLPFPNEAPMRSGKLNEPLPVTIPTLDEDAAREKQFRLLLNVKSYIKRVSQKGEQISCYITIEYLLHCS